MTNHAGRLLLTFDDRHVDGWVDALPLFDAVGARATFFVVEADLLDASEQAGIERLLAGGHTVGSHGARHRNADDAITEFGVEGYLDLEIRPSIEALKALGASARHFAYPNSRRDATSDGVLLGVFDRVRGGGPRTADAALARAAIIAPGDDTRRRVHPGRGCDTGRGATTHPDDRAVLSALLRDLADQGGSLTLYAHEIAEAGAGNHLHPDRLAQILHEAAELGLDLLGWDELPTPGEVGRHEPSARPRATNRDDRSHRATSTTTSTNR